LEAFLVRSYVNGNHVSMNVPVEPETASDRPPALLTTFSLCYERRLLAVNAKVATTGAREAREVLDLCLFLV
jgi:hypothetical protein